MLFWIIAALIALAVAALLAAPLLRPAPAGTGAQDVAIYRDQLAEVDRDMARGLLDAAEAERTRTEIARRLLAADATHERTADGPRGSRALAALAGAAVVGGSLLAYGWIGTPGYPDLPLAARMQAAEARLAALPAQAEAEAAVAALIAETAVTPPDDILATVAELRAIVAEDPGALGELMLLRDFEAGTRNFPEAARLAAQIVAAQGDAAPLNDLLAQMELMVLATNGIVSDEAAQVLERLVAAAPDHPGVLFYRGLLMDNIGRHDLSFGLWRPLAEAADASPWRDRARMLAPDAAWAAGVDYALPPEAAPETAPGPTAADIAAAADMDPADREAFVRSMVEGLSARLATEGGTAEDWAQLIRALGVLGETDRARAIWSETQATFAGQPGLDLIAQAAADAGVAQ